MPDATHRWCAGCPAGRGCQAERGAPGSRHSVPVPPPPPPPRSPPRQLTTLVQSENWNWKRKSQSKIIAIQNFVETDETKRHFTTYYHKIIHPFPAILPTIVCQCHRCTGDWPRSRSCHHFPLGLRWTCLNVGTRMWGIIHESLNGFNFW